MFLVTVHDPYSEHPHLTDEEFRCEHVTALADRLEEETGWPRTECDDAARAVLRGCEFGDEFERDGRTVEVTARRVGELSGSPR